MAQHDRHALGLRLLPLQLKELSSVAKRHGQSKQAFVEALVLKALADEKDRQSVRPDDEPSFGRPNIDAPTSLLAEALRQDRIKANEPSQQREQSQVVVNVGNNGSGHGANAEIDRMASYIASGGNVLERDTRMRTVVTILKESATSSEEAKVLAARLDEAVAAKTKTSSLGDGDSGSLGRTARVAFDKLSELWKGL